MRRSLALFYVTLAFCAACAGQSTAQTLYYLDQHRNVSAVTIEPTALRASRHRVLSTAGGYHGYCVSPDETQVLGWKQIGAIGEFPVFKFFLEQKGRRQEKIHGPASADGTPSAEWLPGNKLLLITIPQQAETQSVLYSLRSRKVTCDSTDAISVFSSDQLYCFVEEDIGHDATGAARLRVLDTHSGKTRDASRVTYDFGRETTPYVWLGKTHMFAVLDSNGRVLAGEVRATRSGPSLRTWRLTRHGACSGLRYVPGKGVYFVQGSGKARRAYISADLRRLAGTALLPPRPEEPWAQSEVVNGLVAAPGGRIAAVAETGPPGQTGTVAVVGNSGQRLVVGRGTRPRWKGGNWW